MKAECAICPRRCAPDNGQTGFCGARKNIDGKIICENYGKITSMALDPIEKKPLRRFCPGTYVLSVGSFGCNLRCPFCQNHGISMLCGKPETAESAPGEKIGAVVPTPGDKPETVDVEPETLVKKALSLKNQGNIGIAYTYNEPLIGYEYVMDCAQLAHSHGLKNAIVTNGYINEKPLSELLPFIDAMNIDLKCFNAGFYEKLCGSPVAGGEQSANANPMAGGGLLTNGNPIADSLEAVKGAISLAAVSTHVEVTTLIVPNENDSPDEMEKLSYWLSTIDDNIPLHVSRFFPRYKYSDRFPTPISTVHELAAIASKNLRHVFTGNC